ncbi:hypothetical protein [Actinomadura hibisca]|uniref:hypothetical protein n=1 Tax=Actinomadura hibisca TaxID=68565 RepID=UPI00082CD30C|nr:hypothetical protein [Actinomadura hibisca]
MRTSARSRRAVATVVALSALSALSVTVAVEGTASAGTAITARALRSAPGNAVNLRVTPQVRRALGDTYFAAVRRDHPRETRDRVVGPEQVYYGKIVGTSAATTVYWAAGETGFSDDPVSRQDGPHVWRKKGAGAWTYLGDTGGWLCGVVPDRLLRVWGRLDGCV